MWNDFEGLYEFHGHKCPMSTLGARLALAAMHGLGVGKADQFKIKAHYLSANCGLDGVQYVSGCTLGNGNLSFEDSGRAELRISMRDGSRSVAVTVTEEAIGRFGEHRKLRLEVDEASAAGMEEERLSTLRRELESRFRALTEWVQGAPDDELVAPVKQLQEEGLE